LDLRVLLPDKHELAIVLAKVQDALDLIASHDPRRAREAGTLMNWPGLSASSIGQDPGTSPTSIS
jgi:hypothetical protein